MKILNLHGYHASAQNSSCLALEKKGFSVYLGEKIPAGDGGLAVGQLYLISSC